MYACMYVCTQQTEQYSSLVLNDIIYQRYYPGNNLKVLPAFNIPKAAFNAGVTRNLLLIFVGLDHIDYDLLSINVGIITNMYAPCSPLLFIPTHKKCPLAIMIVAESLLIKTRVSITKKGIILVMTLMTYFTVLYQKVVIMQEQHT